MDRRAVVALAVVLGDDLPVRPDVVREPRRARQPRHVPAEARVVREPVAHVLAQRRRDVLVGEAQEDEPLPRLAADRLEPERLEAEVLEVLGVLGPDELAVEVVDPGVVGALEADRRAALPLLDRGAPVAAHVVERADDVVLAAHEQQLLAQHVRRTKLPGPAISSARPTAIQSRKKISSRSHAYTASSWYAIPGSSVALRNGARMSAMASGGDGGGVRGVGWTMAKKTVGLPPISPDREQDAAEAPPVTRIAHPQGKAQ